MSHCQSKNGCALDVLAEWYPDDKAGNVAMSWTCFPFDCEVASVQAREIVDRLKAGESEASVFADLDGRIRKAMELAAESTP